MQIYEESTHKDLCDSSITNVVLYLKAGVGGKVDSFSHTCYYYHSIGSGVMKNIIGTIKG